MVHLFDKQTDTPLGTITDEQLQFLMDRLEEESPRDDDYYLNRATLDFLESEGAAPALLEVLRRSLGDREETEIRWSRE